MSNGLVMLELPSRSVQMSGGSSESIENLLAIVGADISGNFTVCAPAHGTFDLVASSVNSPIAATTVTNGVGARAFGLRIPLIASQAASATGTVSTQNGQGLPGNGDQILFFGLQPYTPANSNQSAIAVVPFTNAINQTIITNGSGTAAGQPSCQASCPPNTNCGCYSLSLPLSNPVVGTASTTGAGYSMPSAGAVTYALLATASSLGGNGPLECSPNQLASLQFTLASSGANVPTIAFSQCD